MTDTPMPNSDRDSRGRFVLGHSGGRPFGARNRVSRKMLLEMHRDIEAYKAELLHRLHSAYSPNYFKALARMMTQMAPTGVSNVDDYSDAAAARLVARLREALAANADPRAALAELDAALASVPRKGAGHARRKR